MGNNIGMLKYFIGVLLFNAFPMYVFGSGLMTSWQFVKTLVFERSMDAAVQFAFEYYSSKLTPFPLNEFLTASGFEEVVTSIGTAVVVGAIIASIKWRANV